MKIPEIGGGKTIRLAALLLVFALLGGCGLKKK